MKGIRVLLLFCMWLPAWVAQAADVKIGAVSLDKIMSEAPQAEQAIKRLQQEFAPRERALVDAQKSLRNQEQKLTKDSEVMSEAQRRKLEGDIIAKRREVQRSADEFREDWNLRRNEELGKLQKQITEVINGLAKEDGFDLVIYGNALLYASERVDITDKVLERLKKR